MKYSRDDIAKAFVTTAAKSGKKQAVKELAAMLLDQRLHGEIEELLDDIAREYQRQHGFVEAEVKTAYPLSSELKDELAAKVKAKTGAKKVSLHEQIDKSLLGGVIVSAPDIQLDLSLRSKLDSMQRGSI